MLDEHQRDSTADVEWFGFADCITAGFPCQDISHAGGGAGLAGERSGLWWQVRRTIRMVRPRVALLENVAALLHRGLGTVLGSLAAIGYDAEWHCIQAARFGAPHERDRCWIIAADAHRDGEYACTVDAEMEKASASRDFNVARRENIERRPRSSKPSGGGIVVPADAGRRAHEWPPEPALVRVVHGLPGELDESDPAAVHALGNSVVPVAVEALGRAILRAKGMIA